jgi:LysM repeat protein
MLKDAAVAAGTDTATLRALNPELIHAVTPTRVSVYPLRIPSGSADQFVAAFDELGSGRHYTYVTRVGETLEMAARRLDVPARVLRSVNGLQSTVRVPYRTKLLVPAESIPDAGLSPGDDLLPWLSTRESARRERVQITALVPETRFVYPHRGQWFYRTRKGDTLEELGTKLGVEPADIAMWNALDAGAPILGGFVLQLFLPQGGEQGALVFHPDQTDIVYEGTDSWAQAYATVHRRRPAGTASRGGRTYRVRAGDTIGSIAKRMGVSPDEIRRWNNIRGRRLRPGYRLVLYGKGRAKARKASDSSAPRAASRRTARKRGGKKGGKGVNKGRTPPWRATRRASRRADVRYRRH